MFMYSKRKGTVAEKMDNQVEIGVKKARLSRLIDFEREISSKISESFVGKTVRVLVEEESLKRKGMLIGSLDQGKAINFEGSPDLIGSFVDVKVTKAKLTTLFGELVCEE